MSEVVVLTVGLGCDFVWCLCGSMLPFCAKKENKKNHFSEMAKKINSLPMAMHDRGV